MQEKGRKKQDIKRRKKERRQGDDRGELMYKRYIVTFLNKVMQRTCYFGNCLLVMDLFRSCKHSFPPNIGQLFRDHNPTTNPRCMFKNICFAKDFTLTFQTNKCPDRGLEVELSALLGHYGRQTKRIAVQVGVKKWSNGLIF